jgi:hypothetical protein
MFVVPKVFLNIVHLPCVAVLGKYQQLSTMWVMFHQNLLFVFQQTNNDIVCWPCNIMFFFRWRDGNWQHRIPHSIPWFNRIMFPGIKLQQLIVGYTNGYTVVYLLVQTHTLSHIIILLGLYVYISPCFSPMKWYPILDGYQFIGHLPLVLGEKIPCHHRSPLKRSCPAY